MTNRLKLDYKKLPEEGDMTLDQIAKAMLLKEVRDLYVEARDHADDEGWLEETPQEGDFVTYREYLATTTKPEPGHAAVLHEVWDEPMFGHQLGMTGTSAAVEEFNCVIAVLHTCEGTTTMMMLPTHTARLKKVRVPV